MNRNSWIVPIFCKTLHVIAIALVMIVVKGGLAVAADTTPPSVPTNLTATAVSNSQINLFWNASGDAVGVAGYRIYRDGTSIGTSPANSYSDTTVSSKTTYAYRVAAYDAAGNNSTQSASASATTMPGSVPPTISSPDVIESFATPKTFTDGMKFGKCNALTAETSGSASLIADSNYLMGTSAAKSGGFIIRTTNALPATYRLTVDMGDIDFDLTDPNDFEMGVYLPTITAVPGAPTTNDWWHSFRKLHIDVDNNFWGWGGEHPIFIGYYDPSSLTESDPANGQLVYDQQTSSWVEINTNWASALNYERNAWYTFEIEKTATTYFFRIFDAFSHALLREASIPISSVRTGDDYLAIGDPHVNYYKGHIKIKNLRITNINCDLPVIDSFSANPTTITAGGSTVLNWSVTGASSLSISDVGTVTGNSKTVAPPATTTYVLTATNSFGSDTASTTVGVSTTAPLKRYIEAENATSLTSPFKIANSTTASNGKYIYVQDNTGNSYQPGKGVASFPVNINKAGQYVLWGRVSAAENSDSFFVQIDNGLNYFWSLEKGSAWHWDQVNDQTSRVDPLKFTLSAGAHTIKIKLREDGSKIDRIFLTNDLSLTAGMLESNRRIYAVGDSITRGFTDSPVYFGYRDHLQESLGVGAYDFVGPYSDPSTDVSYDVNHGGLNGRKSAALLAKIDQDLNVYLPKPNTPDTKVLVFIGTNDSAGSTPGVPPPPVPPQTAVNNVVSIVNKITAYDSNIHVYVALITPHRGKGSVKNNPNFIAYNSALRPAILSLNSSNPKVHLVDMYKAFENDTFGLLGGQYLNTAYNDDTHPNDLGYRVIAKQWYACIQNPLSVNCDGH